MIVSFRHKGLAELYNTGTSRRLPAAQLPKLRNLLALIDAASAPDELNLPGLHLHKLQGDLAGHYSVRVTGNYRLTFRFVGQDVELLDYVDYH